MCGHWLLKLPVLAFTPSAGRTQQLGFQTAVATCCLCIPSITSPLMKVSAPPINQASLCTEPCKLCPAQLQRAPFTYIFLKQKTKTFPFPPPNHLLVIPLPYRPHLSRVHFSLLSCRSQPLPSLGSFLGEVGQRLPVFQGWEKQPYSSRFLCLSSGLQAHTRTPASRYHSGISWHNQASTVLQ